VERSSGPGGRAGSLTLDGYRFDTGPTVLTMPDLVEQCFAAAGADMSRYLTLQPVDPMYRACYADGSELRVLHGRDAMSEEIRTVCGASAVDGFHRFCDWLRDLYELEMPNFIARNWESPLDLARPLGPALALMRAGGFRRLEPKVRSFFDDERLVRLFSFQSLYAGLAPYQALALYAVISYMDTVNGVVVPEGGMHALPLAMARAATDAGVRFHYGAAVERIRRSTASDGAVIAVDLEGGEHLDADTVVCTVDLPMVYRALLPDVPEPRRLRTGRLSPSALVWHAGVRGPLPAGVAHHNLHFGVAWHDAFRELLRDGTRMADASLLVTVPTVDEPGMAPPGGHVLYVLEPVPNLTAPIDWKMERARAQSDLLERVDRLGYPVDVEVEQLVDPTDWLAEDLAGGTPFSFAHTFRQTGPFRAANREPRVPGLFFAGSSTVPGVGVPMVLISGKLAADRVRAYGGIAR
jgi:phytoene desaturase